MTSPVGVAAATSTRITGWRIEEGSLVLTIEGEPRPLRCVCDRCHWIVESQERGGRATLAVTCHGCGRGCVLPLAAS